MGSVWKRLQRVNKRAAKFQFTSSYHELRVETTAKWRPTNLSVVWTRRSRRVASAPLPWEPDMMNPLVGHISWPVPDNHTITVTLFKDPRSHELEDKDWTFIIEDITQLGKKRVLASASINMRKYASIESTQQSFTLTLKPVSRKITSAEIELTISCVFLREGKATDEDMQSVVSLMSVNNNCDVAPLDDLEDIPDVESCGDISEHLYDFTQQLEQLTSSLNGCIDLATPMSVPSLSEDPTPLAEGARLSFEEADKLDDDTQQTPSGAPNLKEELITEVPISKPTPSLPPPTTITTNTTTTMVATQESRSAAKTQPLKHEQKPDQPKSKSIFVNSSALSKKSISSGDDVDRKLPALKGEKLRKAELDCIPPSEDKNITFTHEAGLKNDIKEQNDEVKSKLTIIGKDKEKDKVKDKVKEKDKENDTQDKVRKSGQMQTFETSHPKNRTDIKRPELQPLNLKKNYENGPSTTTNKVVEKIILKENTPGQDLLEWCKEVTKDYSNVKVTNLTTSWRNGIAFCAIIHHFEPSLVDMTKLSSHDVVGNCRTAFDAAESLGIPRVIEPRDMSMLAVPDKLAVMTYLHQLRAHFTGKQLHIEQIGPTCDESSYVIGNYKSDNLSQNLLNLNNYKANLRHHNSIDDDSEKPPQSPTSKKDVKNLIYSGSKNLLGKVLSPVKDKNTINALQQPNNNPIVGIGNNNTNTPISVKDKPALMTRRELTDPFGSDEEENSSDKKDHVNQDGKQNSNDNQNVNTNSGTTKTAAVVAPPLDPNKTNRLLSRHKEMSEKAKAMREKLKITTNENGRLSNEDGRKQRLLEQARRLINETRSKTGSGDSPTSPTKRFPSSSPASSPLRTKDEFVFLQNGGSGTGSPKAPLSPTKKITPPRDIIKPSEDGKTYNLSPSHRLSERNGNSPLQSFNAVVERISPKTEKRGDKLSYIESELEALEREQEAIDKNASALEKKLRAVMGGNPKTDETEEELLSQWFTLVNKKNALLRRQMQLNILEQESDLELKYALLNQELRAAQSVEDWRKPEAQREKEKLLLEELVAIVNQRDQLVQRMHNEEIAIEDDHEIARELEQVDISGVKEKCVIQ